ncbi:hypothetical protein ACHAXT_002850 [Thalassiosira profunda]
MPATVYLVTGGARSGKSSYAQSLCESLDAAPVYLATSKAWDDDFQRRVKRHQDERGDRWTTIEEPLRPSQHSDVFKGRAVLVDCLTLWLTNYFTESGVFSEPDGDNDAKASGDEARMEDAATEALARIKAEFDKMAQQWDATFVFVSNEIGSGLHAETPASRKFVDAQGWLNQHVASKADMVVHMVAGVPSVIKQLPTERRNPLKPPSSEERNKRAILDQFLSARSLAMDDKGYFLMKLDHDKSVIRATYHSCMKNDKGELCDLDGNKLSCSGKGPDPMETFEARTAKELTVMIFERWDKAKELVTVGHAAYVGREAQRAERCLFGGGFYQQD